MQPQQPIPASRKPRASDMLRWSNATRGLRLAYACLAFSVSMLIAVIAADVARSI